jgi:tRNA pseudouridine32 synthase/23S rRNA pseudouridine746 synthase/23S rRNA pseudouridine1911/1915/1917 synthase
MVVPGRPFQPLSQSVLARLSADDSMMKAKPSAKKHQPAGVVILHEDRDIIVVDKASGLLTIGTDRDKTRTAHALLNDYVRKGNPRSKNRVFIVHRLDRETSGILVFARSEEAKLFLQQNWEQTEKSYLAVVHGRLTPREGAITSLLAENAAHHVYSTTDATQGKLAHTVYRVLREIRELSLLEIDLLTGRKHQIRVHLAEKGHPLVGDRRYGRGNDTCPRLALHARSITFQHPVSGQRLTFSAEIPEFFTRLVGRI